MVLELLEQGRLANIGIVAAGVVDPDAEAPAMQLARDRGIATLADLEEGLGLPDLELIVELTGSDEVLDRVRRAAPAGIRVIDHGMARVVWEQEKVALDRAQLQDILDAIPDMVVVLDDEARIVRVNHRFERVTGKLRDRVLRRPVREVFDEEGARGWSRELGELFEKVMTTGQPASVVRRMTTRTGAGAHYKITADPIFNKDLEIVRVVESAREITEMVWLKRDAEEAAHLFQQITDAVHGLVTVKNLAGEYQMVNPWTAKVLGVPREEMIGKTAADLLPKEAAEIVERHDRETLEKGRRHVSEEVVTIDGVRRAFFSERLPLRDYKGDVVGVCCVSQDQTRRRQLQQDLIQTERLAAIGKLAAGVAHEINNPLSGILTFAQDLMMEADPDDPNRKDYELIVNETLRCRRIVRELLEFSRQRSPRRRLVDASDLIAGVLPMIERQASFHNVEIEVSIADDLPALHVDPRQVQQILLNLVINARDAMEASGKVEVAWEASEDGREVILSVRDTGCGIPEDLRTQIFEPFFSTKGEQGNGLGLTAVHNVVERHGGRIELESEVGVGTTFRITLPAARKRA